MEFLTLIVPLLIAIGIFSLRQYQFQKRRKQRTDYYRNDYLKSDAWERKRFVVFRRDNWACVYCGQEAEQVHHLKYARNIGTEPIHWLESVCKSCHNKIHTGQIKANKKRNKRKYHSNKKKARDIKLNFQSPKTSKGEYKTSPSLNKAPKLVQEDLHDDINAKHYIQTNWKTKQFFVLCPENVDKEPIINYLDNLKIGEVFNKAVRYENSESTIEDFCITVDKKKLWVITKIQGWRYGLLEVVYSGGQFNHIAHGTFMTIIGARKELTIKNGNEWLGEDSIDDYI